MRFLSLVLAMVFLAAATEADEVIVLTDGSRIEVKEFEVKENVIVFTTLDGRLRSLPLSYVDLETTQSLGRKLTEPMELSQNHVDNARQALTLYGVKDSVFQLGELLESQLEGAEAQIPKPVLEMLRNAVRKGVDGERVFEVVVQRFALAAEEEALMAWIEWLQSPLARRIVEMEMASQSPEAEEERARFVESLEQEGTPSGRIDLLRRLDEAVRATEAGMDAYFAMMKGMNQAMRSVIPEAPAEQDQELESLRKQLAEGAKEHTIQQMLFTYRSATDPDLQSYIQYWETDSGRRFTELTTDAVMAGIAFAADAIGRAFAEDVRAARQEMTEQGQAPEPQVFEELNFQFTPPETGWAPLDVSSLNPDASLGYMRRKPTVVFMIVAESGGEQLASLTSEGVAAIVQSSIQSVSDSYQLISKEPHLLKDMEGLLLISEARIQNREFHYIHWIYGRHGFFYQLMAYGPKSELDFDALRRHAEEAFQGFGLIDPERVSRGSLGVPLEDHRSTRYGYSLAVAGSGWRSWDDLHEELPDADMGGLHGTTSGFVVIPFCLGGLDPSLDRLSKALLKRLELSPTGDNVSSRKNIGHGKLTGYEIQLERNVEGMDFVYRIQTWKAPHFGYLVAVWTMKEGGSPESLDDLLNRFDIDPGYPPFTGTEELTDQEKSTHGFILNDIGIDLLAQSQQAASIPYLEAADAYKPDDETIVENLMMSYAQAGRHADGLDFIARNDRLFRDNLALLSYRPFLLSQVGRKEEAIRYYRELFERGFQSEYDLSDYTELLWEMGRPTEAVSAVEHYRRDRDSPSAARLEAELHRRSGDYDRAIEILVQKRETAPMDLDLARSLMDAYYEAERYKESLDLAAAFIGKGYESPDIYFRKGQNEISLGWYKAAKVSLQVALDGEPTNANIREHLDYVSGLLGEGDVEAIRHPIPPVSIPAQLRTASDSPPASSLLSDYGAYFVSQARAISYRRNQEYKQTDFLKVKVLDQKAVSRFSSLRFSFDPLDENVYVNELVVTDATGEVRETGEVSDYYVVDDGSGDLATQDKILTIPVSGLEPGHTVELTLTRRKISPPKRLPFVRYVFPSTVPVLKSSLYVEGDIEDMNYRWVNASAPEVSDGSLLWSFASPPVYRTESFVDAVETFLPTVWIGDRTNSWEVLTKDYLKDIEDRLDSAPESQELARSLVSGLNDPEQRIRKIAEYVRDNITYKAIEFGRRAWTPNPFGDIVRNRYGDCKDHSVLFYHLLRAIDIPVSLALVSVSSRVQSEVPSLDQFDHMIAYTPAFGNGHFFDLTDKGFDGSQNPPMGLGGRQALVLDPDSPALCNIPDYPRDSNQVHSKRMLKIVDSSDVEVEETLSLHGYYGAQMRSYLEGLDSSARMRQIQNQMSSSGTVILRELTAENLSSPQSPLVLNIRYLLPGVFHSVEHQISGRITAVWEQVFLSIPHIENRQTPYRLEYPVTIQSDVELTSPGGYHIKLSPSSGNHRDDISDWSMETEKEPTRLRIHYEVRVPNRQGPASDYQLLETSLNRSLEALERSIVFEKTS